MALKYFFYLCVLFLSLGQFASFGKFGELNLYLFDITVGLFAFGGTLYFLVRKTFKLPAVSLLFFLFTVLAASSLVFNISKLSFLQFGVAGFYLLRWSMYLLAGVVVFNIKKANFLSSEEIFKTFILSGVFISLAGFVQLFVLPDFTALDPSLGWDPHKNRLCSTFFDPNFTGAYLVFVVILLWAKKITGKFDILAFLILVIAVFLTFSRSVWLMYAFAAFVYGLYRYRWLIPLSLLTGFLAYYGIPRVQTRISGFTDPTDSAHLRLISWGNAWNISKDNLFGGVGFNAYRYAQYDGGSLDFENFLSHSGSGTDSSILFVLATTGVFGLFVFLLSFGFLVLDPLLQRNKRAFIFSLATTGCLFLGSLFINSVFYPQIMFFWIITFFTRLFDM